MCGSLSSLSRYEQLLITGLSSCSNRVSGWKGDNIFFLLSGSASQMLLCRRQNCCSLWNKIPVLDVKWMCFIGRKNNQFRLRVTEWGVEKEPTRGVHLKQEDNQFATGWYNWMPKSAALAVADSYCSWRPARKGQVKACLSVSSDPWYSCSSAQAKPNNWVTTELCCVAKLWDQGSVTCALAMAVTMVA